ncbi:MAG: hypothetical protein SVU32_00140 [Candidatus Nanohaloarchaea archaeon]|nr:hypothetical protein [Candidatus Nanohaloarchaea archaeon]
MVNVTLKEKEEDKNDETYEAVYEVDVSRNKLSEYLPGTRNHAIGKEKFYPDSKLEHMMEEEGFETEYEGGTVFQDLYVTKKPFKIRVSFDKDVDQDYLESFRQQLEETVQTWADKWDSGMRPTSGPVDEE